MGKKELYFIRHARATNDASVFHLSMFDRDMVEEIDEPLSETGRLQAALLAHSVRNLGIERIVSSTRRRAVETARILSQNARIPYNGGHEGLAEINFGRCRVRRNLLTRVLMSGRWPRQMRKPLDRGLVTTFSIYYFLLWYRGKTMSGESVPEIYNRIDRMMEMLRTFPETRIAVIGHAGWIWCLALKVMDCRWNFWKLSRVCNCSMTRIDTDGDGKSELKFFAVLPAIIAEAGSEKREKVKNRESGVQKPVARN